MTKQTIMKRNTEIIMYMAIMAVIVMMMAFASCKGKSQNQVSTETTDSMDVAIASLKCVAHIIDTDDESYWAYGQADSLLNISAHTQKYADKRTAEFDALTHIFYGMSYTRAVMSGQEALANLGKIFDCVNRKTGFSEPINSELNAINACITFYEVSNMSTAKDMRKKYDDFATRYKKAANTDANGDIHDKYYALNNKKLFFMMFGSLISDLSYTVAKNDPERQNIQSWANQLDAIPSESIDDIKGMSNEVYQQNLRIAEHIQVEMIDHLAKLIAKLK